MNGWADSFFLLDWGDMKKLMSAKGYYDGCGNVVMVLFIYDSPAYGLVFEDDDDISPAEAYRWLKYGTVPDGAFPMNWRQSGIFIDDRKPFVLVDDDGNEVWCE